MLLLVWPNSHETEIPKVRVDGVQLGSNWIHFRLTTSGANPVIKKSPDIDVRAAVAVSVGKGHLNAAVSLAASIRQALVLRVVLGILVGLPVTGLAFLHLGWASPVGVVFAVPAGYLLYAAVKDGLSLVRNSPAVERPRFLWFVIAGVLCIGYWSSVLWG